MPEAIDFGQIARAILGDDDPELLGDLLEGMRQVWNARGAADLDAMQPIIGKLGDTMDPDNAVVFVSTAIKALDR
jgi:hypothetical protein